MRLMKRRKSSPPEDTATEESTPFRQSVADVRLSLRPRMVSPESTGTAAYKRLHTPQNHAGCHTPLSLLRNSSRVRMAATAEAMSGSSLICALKYSTSSDRGDTGRHGHYLRYEPPSRR